MAGATVAHRGELPPFLADRNERARRAGLSITRAVVKDGKACHWYEGTQEQILAAGFRLRNEDWKWPTRGERPGHLVIASPASPWLIGRHCGNLKVLGDGRFRVSTANEPLPTSWRTASPGVEVYEFVDENAGRVAAFMGKPAALAACELVDQAALQEDRGWLGGYTSAPAVGIGLGWDAMTLPDGRRFVRVYLDAPARLERWRRERARTSIADLDAYRERLVRLGAFISATMDDLDLVGKDGSRYSVTQDSVDEIAVAAATLRGLLETAVIQVHRPHVPKVTEQAVTKARGDEALQSWLRGIGGRDA